MAALLYSTPLLLLLLHRRSVEGGDLPLSAFFDPSPAGAIVAINRIAVHRAFDGGFTSHDSGVAVNVNLAIGNINRAVLCCAVFERINCLLPVFHVAVRPDAYVIVCKVLLQKR